MNSLVHPSHEDDYLITHHILVFFLNPVVYILAKNNKNRNTVLFTLNTPLIVNLPPSLVKVKFSTFSDFWPSAL